MKIKLIKNFFLLFALLFLLSYCNRELSVLEQKRLIDVTINETLKLDSNINTKILWVDFSKTNIQTQAITEFLQNNLNFIQINGDSLINNNINWKEYGFIENTLIQIISITNENGYYYIKCRKTIAIDGSCDIEIQLEKRGEFFYVISSEITIIY